MMWIENRTGRGGNTPRLHHKHMRVDAPAFLCIGQDLARDKSCVYDGGEIGSTDGE